MPEVSRFYGIVIKIFYDDHNPPHFHAEAHQPELMVAWERARQLQPPGRIAPLP
jgi:hypothetical protein